MREVQATEANAHLARLLSERLSATRMNERLEALKWLPFQTDSEVVLDMVVSLARIYKLSVYDAVYLELAKRRFFRLEFEALQKSILSELEVLTFTLICFEVLRNIVPVLPDYLR